MPHLPSTSLSPSLQVIAMPDPGPTDPGLPQATRCRPMLQDWINATLTAACLADRGRAVEIDLHDAQCEVPADTDATAQALLMLLSNACRFSAAGTRLRLTSRVQWADGADHLVIGVCDRGIGMTRAALQRAFDPIATDRGEPESVHPPTTRDGGLRTARHLLEAQGGWIELRSALGIGTEADAWIPLPISADRQA